MQRVKNILWTDFHGEPLYIWFLLVVFFLIRIAYILLFGCFNKSDFLDAYGYNEYALTILNDRTWIVNSDFPASFREPVYPIFVSLIYFFAGAENFLAVYVIQAILSTITIYYIYKLSLLTLQNRESALLALIWAGLYFAYIRYNGELLRETLLVFVVVYFFYIGYKYISAGKIIFSSYIIMALIYTILIHTDGRYLFYAPFLFLMFILKLKNSKISLSRYFVFGALIVLFTFPWTYRNYLTYGELIVVSKFTLSLSGGKLSERSDLFDMSKIDSTYSTIHYSHNENYPTENERMLIKQGQNPKNRSINEIKLIKKDAYPSKTFFGRKWNYIKAMWKPFDFSYGYVPFPQAFFSSPWSFRHNILSIMSYGILLPFFVFGLFISIREHMIAIYFLLIPIFIHFLLHAITFGLERYRHPVDAFIIIIGSYGIIYFYNIIVRSETKNNPANCSVRL